MCEQLCIKPTGLLVNCLGPHILNNSESDVHSGFDLFGQYYIGFPKNSFAGDVTFAMFRYERCLIVHESTTF